jgi:hypothetical protein
MNMFKKTNIAAAMIAAIILLIGSVSIASAQDKSGGKASKGSAGDSIGSTGVGDPKSMPGMERLYDPTGSRKDPVYLISDRHSDRFYDPTTSRKTPTVISDRELNRYNGIAQALNTTPDALRVSYLSWVQNDPALAFGEFVAAGVVSQNLKKKYAGLTHAAILASMKNGASLGSALKKLGVDADVAKIEVKEAKKKIADSRQAQ